LAEDYKVSPSTLSRFFARPEIAEELRLRQREEEQRANEPEPDHSHVALADHLAAKISDVWCPLHRRRTYIRNVDRSSSEIRLEVAGCCDEAIQELVRWLKIYRAVLPTGAVFTPAGHAPASATVRQPELPMLSAQPPQTQYSCGFAELTRTPSVAVCCPIWLPIPFRACGPQPFAGVQPTMRRLQYEAGMLDAMAHASLARVRRAADRAVVCERCEIPGSAFGRMRGLLGRSGLEPGTGMLIDRAPSVHMFFMRFPIDVVFVDRDWRVVGIRHGLRPWRVAGARRAAAALELPAGAAAAAGLEEGDVLALEDQAGVIPKRVE
jgi:hypothetical protein